MLAACERKSRALCPGCWPAETLKQPRVRSKIGRAIFKMRCRNEDLLRTAQITTGNEQVGTFRSGARARKSSLLMLPSACSLQLTHLWHDGLISTVQNTACFNIACSRQYSKFAACSATLMLSTTSIPKPAGAGIPPICNDMLCC